MKSIVWLGNPFFHKALASRVQRVHYFRLDSPRPISWSEILHQAGFAPDALVMADKSWPPVISRIENFPCLTVFFSVDSHIHGWHSVYAQAFDLCAVSLRDHIPRFHGPWLDSSRVLWLPAYAKDEDIPAGPAEMLHDLLFVGTVDVERTPGRMAFLERLGARMPGLAVRRGDYRRLFPQGKIVLNHAERGDLNFRVFEALGCGACLLTPKVGHGLTDLFEDGKDLFLYDPEDMDGLVGLVDRLLSDEGLRRRVAASGQAKVDQNHRARHRAGAFHDFLDAQDASGLVRRRLEHAATIHDGALKLLYLHLAETVEFAPLRESYLDLSRFRPDC